MSRIFGEALRQKRMEFVGPLVGVRERRGRISGDHEEYTHRVGVVVGW